MNDWTADLIKVKTASAHLTCLDDKQRNTVLYALANKLRESCNEILKANQNDLALMNNNDPKFDRLILSSAAIHAMANDIITVAMLPTPVNQSLEERIRPNGLRIEKIAVPLGVVAVIYEARPNVTIDVFSLCFKTGNACVLKGGREALNSNTMLAGLITQTLQEHGIDQHACYLLPPQREASLHLLSAIGLVDVCIPRGSQSLINFVRENAKIPVIETGAGIVHTYFDVSGDIAKGRSIINNAKTRRVSVCNALDTLIIHEHALPNLADLIEPLKIAQVELYADLQAYQAIKSFYPSNLLHIASPADFGQEFLSYKLSIKTVASIEDAVLHIKQYTSGHSEAIIANDKAAINYFLNRVDAAAVYVNASTAFTDGGQFGMGAEIGISTQKLHARGPMGLEALTSYKWIVWGDGQIRE